MDNRAVIGANKDMGDKTMLSNLYLATNNGLWIAEHNEREWLVASHALERHHVTSVIAREGVILAGTRQGVFRSTDGGRAWHEADKQGNDRQPLIRRLLR